MYSIKIKNKNVIINFNYRLHLHVAKIIPYLPISQLLLCFLLAILDHALLQKYIIQDCTY